MDDVKYLVVDLFAGAGGTTTGFEMIGQGMVDRTGLKDKCGNGKPYKVIVAVNHDPVAIESHWMNHPEVYHFNEDITMLDMGKLSEVVDGFREMYPYAKLILWASLECTNFSKAKGGMPRDADSRTLADHLGRYVDTLMPDKVMIENVVEFMSWGPLDDNGKPVSRKNGTDWLRWRKEINERGYVDEWRELNSADFGAYTSRTRLFGIFAKSNRDIKWPLATHAKKVGAENGMFGQLKKWNAVKHCLDFEDEGGSIFDRKIPLVEKTLERIYAGLVKFVANGKEPEYEWILKYNSMNTTGNHVPPGIDEPCPTVAAQSRLGIVKALPASNEANGGMPIYFIQKHYSGRPDNKVVGIEAPGPTITTSANQSLVKVSFLQHYYGNGFCTEMEAPCPTLRTKDSVTFVTSQYSGGGQLSDIESPCPTLVANPKQSICTAKAGEPIRYLMNPQYASKGSDVEKPCFTLIARMDKMPPYLITAECGRYGVAVYEDDSPMMQKIKLLMATHNLVDIKMRMLKVPELLKIQGFPVDYKLAGNQTHQKRFIGNAVEPHVVKAWGEAML
ncbi:MAG: DNA cytosine methyltransferase [Leadbetterella sp.]|nr:DNA cytosine methyltransferase [Leadbetterella sp.]